MPYMGAPFGSATITSAADPVVGGMSEEGRDRLRLVGLELPRFGGG